MRSEIKIRQRKCPGCKLVMPRYDEANYDGYFHCSPECWTVFSEAIGFEFSNAVVFSQVHQMTVDAYAVSHTGGVHPDKSIAIHLVGLHASLEQGIHQIQIPRMLQKVADQVNEWPILDPPISCGPMNIFDVVVAKSPSQYMSRVKKWAQFVWQSWLPHHNTIASLYRDCISGIE